MDSEAATESAGGIFGCLFIIAYSIVVLIGGYIGISNHYGWRPTYEHSLQKQSHTRCAGLRSRYLWVRASGRTCTPMSEKTDRETLTSLTHVYRST
jgi:hypothetical protein